MERDCKTCIHKVPVFDEEGYCKYAECDSWNCEYVNRKEALKAYQILKEHIYKIFLLTK